MNSVPGPSLHNLSSACFDNQAIDQSVEIEPPRIMCLENYNFVNFDSIQQSFYHSPTIKDMKLNRLKLALIKTLQNYLN